MTLSFALQNTANDISTLNFGKLSQGRLPTDPLSYPTLQQAPLGEISVNLQ